MTTSAFLSPEAPELCDLPEASHSHPTGQPPMTCGGATTRLSFLHRLLEGWAAGALWEGWNQELRPAGPPPGRSILTLLSPSVSELFQEAFM